MNEIWLKKWCKNDWDVFKVRMKKCDSKRIGKWRTPWISIQIIWKINKEDSIQRAFNWIQWSIKWFFSWFNSRKRRRKKKISYHFWVGFSPLNWRSVRSHEKKTLKWLLFHKKSLSLFISAIVWGFLSFSKNLSNSLSDFKVKESSQETEGFQTKMQGYWEGFQANLHLRAR